jgi:hypothetical protein
MEGKELVGTHTYSNGTVVESYMDYAPVKIDDSDELYFTVYEKLIEPERPKIENVFTTMQPKEINKIRSKKPKAKKLIKLSTVPYSTQKIWETQLAERRRITNDYSLTWDDWCRQQYDVDVNL